MHFEIQERLAGTEAAVLRASTDAQTGTLTLEIGRQDLCFLVVVLAPVPVEPSVAGKLAVVIDDFGDRLDSLVQAFFGLDGAVTVSVLPGRKWSEKVARTASAAGCEVILHLAMEPLQAAFREDGFTILTKMPRADIRATFQRALDQVPGAVGVNNHMGSRATSDRQTMLDVLEAIKQRGLYFVDSRTIASTVAYDVAVELGVPTAKRDVFVDVDGAEEAIRQKLWDLARIAKANGRAVGIGHCHGNMLVALQKEMPKLKDAGYRFVALSNIVR
jgi:hypothetical protein